MVDRITVVVPTLNSVQTLEWTLFSLTMQRDCQVTIVVADSGSTDGTLELCSRYSVQHIYVPPGNMYRAINAGMMLSETHWVTYLNSDDFVYPSSYARLMKCGNENQSDVVYGSCDFVDWEGRFIHSYTPGYPHELLQQFLHAQLSFAQPAAIFTRQLFSELSGFDEAYRNAADLDFFLRAVLAKKRFTMLPGPPVACFRIHYHQKSQDTHQVLNETRHVQNRFGDAKKSFVLDVFRWRARNIPNYMIRILRYLSLNRRLKIVRTLDAWDQVG